MDVNNIEELLELEIIHPEAYRLAQEDKEKFILLRKVAVGASDTSALLDVNPYKTYEELLEDKKRTCVTVEELRVGQLEAVRKGSDLEPLILKKFEAWSKLKVTKPSAMYRSKKYPDLLVDFDGLMQIGESYIPVEAKFCSRYATKYWNKDKACATPVSGTRSYTKHTDPKLQINLQAEYYGIPAYYYTQIQQQMLLTGTEFGYFAVLLDQGWEFRAYKIFKDELIQQAIIEKSKELMEKVRRTR